jgi:hypothetical protein
LAYLIPTCVEQNNSVIFEKIFLTKVYFVSSQKYIPKSLKNITSIAPSALSSFCITNWAYLTDKPFLSVNANPTSFQGI